MKRISLEQLAGVLSGLPANPRIVASGNFATPHAVLDLADRTLETFTLHMLNAQPGIPDREGITYETCFVGPGMRHSESLVYVPSRLSLVPSLFQQSLRPDAVVLHTSIPRYDTVSLGIEVNVLPAAVEAARERGAPVIAQANARMPYTYGDAQIYDHEIDYLVEVDEPLVMHTPRSPGLPDRGGLADPPGLPDRGGLADPPGHIEAAIGELIAAQIGDESTLQLGIGGIPDAVVAQLRHRRGLRIWSEMISDGVLGLHNSGALDGDVPLVASFLFGSQELYDFVHLNRRVRLLRTEVTNAPGRIAQQPRMASVNAAMQVDLFDQANASRINGSIYSGFGGSVDFIVGAIHARGGASYMALPSWHHRSGTSTIVPRLEEPVTSFQHTAVVTEQGLARVWGLSESQQAQCLIDHAAHPDARDGLREEAARMGLA
ncbi:MAG: acetyl-CoA hydrolase/transferase family protein [Actinomycetota bacterium]